MLEKIAIITDSNACLNEEDLKRGGIFVLPIVLTHENQSFKENVDLTEEEFISKIKEKSSMFKTSQPALGDLIAIYEEIQKDYDSVLVLHCSSGVSGTMDTSTTASKVVGIKTSVVDTKTGLFPLRQLILRAKDLIDSGARLSQVEEEIKKRVPLSNLLITPANLDQMKKSGRVSGTSSLVSSMIGLKLVLGFDENGCVTLKEKVRTEKKTQKYIFDVFEKDYNAGARKVSVMHAYIPEKAEEWKKALLDRFPDLEVEISGVSAGIVIHTGIHTIGMAWELV